MQVNRLNELPGQDASRAFLVLPENRFAHRVLESLGENASGSNSSFVYLYGPSGAGKTLLIQSMLSRLVIGSRRPSFKCVSASDFLSEFSLAAEDNSFAKLRKQFQRKDIIAFDDLQVLSDRKEAQRQLQLILDDATSHGCHIVMSCRTSIVEAGVFIPQLIDRCHGAVTVALRLPSLQSRQKLIRHWTQELGFDLNEEIVDFLSETFAVSPRELFGLTTQLKSLASLSATPLELKLVKRHLTGHHPARTLLAGEIAKCVSRHFQITLAALRSASRQPRVVLPRQCAIFLIRELTDWSLKRIGEYFGGRDHSTILHACQKLNELMPNRADIRLHLHKIRTQLNLPDTET